MNIFIDALSDKLTDLDSGQFDSFPGMAHFAGTGPRGLTCRECRHWHHESFAYYARTGKWGGLIKPALCAKYKALTGKQGAAVPNDAASCRHFVINDKPPPRYSR